MRSPFRDEWFDGDVWVLEPLKDTRAKDAENLRRSVYEAARNRNVRVRTAIRDGVVYMQALMSDTGQG